MALVGYFDPMHAAHVRRLGEISREGDRLAVIVAEPPDPILPLRARAELVAGLGAVCFVIEAGNDVDGVLQQLAPRTIIDDREGDRRRSQSLAQRIVERCLQK